MLFMYSFILGGAAGIEDACGDVTGRSPNLDSSGRCGTKGWGDGRVESVRGAILSEFGGKLGRTKN